MSKGNSNCCDTNNSDCNAPETNCCASENNAIIGGGKKLTGWGILLLAIILAVFSAIGNGQPTAKSNCSSDEINCSSSCETGVEDENCCTK